MDAKITCSICNEEFPDMSTALRHVETEHPETP